MNAGVAIAIVMGPLLYGWLARHAGFTFELVKEPGCQNMVIKKSNWY
jgi:hypothetical protein